jgi:hypothetical protein
LSARNGGPQISLSTIGPKPFWGRIPLQAHIGQDPLRIWILPAGQDEVIIEEDVLWSKSHGQPTKINKRTYLVKASSPKPYPTPQFRYLVRKDELISNNGQNSKVMIRKKGKNENYNLNIEITSNDKKRWWDNGLRRFFFDAFDYGSYRMSWFERAIVVIVLLFNIPSSLLLMIFDAVWPNAAWLIMSLSVLLFLLWGRTPPSQKLAHIVELLISMVMKFFNNS